MPKPTQTTGKGYIRRLQESRTFKGVSLMLAMNLLVELIHPTISLALTEGPSQPEVQSFEPIGTTQMVDLFTGDFNYNIPLFNLPGPNGGYPVNLAYHAGVSMDDEASWVGLGWNLNVGALVRNMRGLPDEFLSKEKNGRIADENYDHLNVKTDMKQSWTLGVSGGLSTELFGGDPLPSFGLSGSFYFNNYKGLGFSVEPSLGIGQSNEFSLGISLDSENGLGVNTKISHKGIQKGMQNQHNLGLNFDGNLSMSYGFSRSRKIKNQIQTTVGNSLETKSITSFRSQIGGFSSSLSFARSSFTTGYVQNVNHYNGSVSFGFGTSIITFMQGKSSLGVNFNTQDYSEIDKEGRPVLVSGYDQLGESESDRYLRDFSRGMDGQITKQTVLLSPSHYSFDTYSSTGQGIMGYFRPRRNDIGRVFDAKKQNESFGASVGFGGGTGTSNQFQGTLGTNFGWEKQGAWNNDAVYTTNDLDQDFRNPEQKGLQENLYYQAHGESTVMLNSDLDYLGGVELANIKLKAKSSDGLVGGKRKIDPNVDFNNSGHNLEDRFERNTLIHELKNKEVANLGEFDIRYYSSDESSDLFTSPNQVLNRSTRRGVDIGNHKAGFKVLNEEGSYYVYGLPAYNNKEVENVFTVSKLNANEINSTPISNSGFDPDFDQINTIDFQMNDSDTEVDYKNPGLTSHQYINKTTKSPYAHSYLLTSVQGADYVDVKNDGPSDDDLGYWVNFDYVKHSNDYQWRMPYENDQAKFNRGASYTTADDKASYQYGEKELWYLGRIETKSHIAIFFTSPRVDNQEALGEYFSANTSNGDSGCKLDSIKVYEKSTFNSSNGDPIPLQTIHLTYADDGNRLCPGTPNSNSSLKGKLTLKSIHFTSLGSKRGERSKYEFDYAGLNLLPYANDGSNPAYADGSYDSWGTYKPLSYDPSGNDFDFYSHFPYTNQFNQGPNWNPEINYNSDPTDDKEETKRKMDEYASVWCLNKIKLPSGGLIEIDYESDDYGYVQHKTANQMFKIVSVNDGTSGENQLYDNEIFHNDFSREDETFRRVWFKLEEPFTGGALDKQAEHVYTKYVEPMIEDESGQRNLYFKSRIELIEGVYDYVSGYLPLEEQRYSILQDEQLTDQMEYNFGTSSDGINGFVTIKAGKKKLKNNGETKYFEKFHPIALSAWTYMQTDAQNLLNNPNSFANSMDESNFMESFADMVNFIPQLRTSFGGIRKYCKDQEMAKKIDLDKSCIRLASPDKAKYGGGHRVSEISITDNWSSDAPSPEKSRTYGQHYSYKMMENDEEISSGVAQYEPQAGGDENALKYPIHFQGKSNVFTRNNLFSEAPVNEALFPGASVGYRQVEVTTLNTDLQRKRLEDANDSPKGRTGGVTVHEFFTAKDFPTMVSYSKLSENLNTKDAFNLPIVIPFVGSIKRNYFHGTQAFMIETNDMHGKPKGVKSYELNNFELNASPITEMTYEYQSKSVSYQGESVFKLDNRIDVIANDGTNAIDGAHHLMGVEVDLFTDQRESKNFSSQIGLDLGVETPSFFPAFLPEFWVTYSNTKSMFRTYTTNKVVHRSGILKRTKSRDLQTVNETEILAYDEKSGVPLLTKVKNEFGDDFYSYNIPAYYQYDQMGHAYRNINYNFTGKVEARSTNTGPNGGEYIYFTPGSSLFGNPFDHLVRGDELLIQGLLNNGRGEFAMPRYATIDGATVPVDYDFGGVPADENSSKKGYFLGYEYDASGKLRGIIHFPEVIDINDFPSSYDVSDLFNLPLVSSNTLNSDITELENNYLKLKVIRSGRRNHYGTMAANYLTKDKLELSGVSTNLGVIDGYQNETKNIAEETVLSATASLFKDDWNNSVLIRERLNPEGTETLLSLGSTTVDNPYLEGNSGIWRPYKSYTYVGSRKSTGNMDDNTVVNEDPSLKNDGVFEDEVPMFSWDLGNLEEYVPNWEWVNEVTRFSPDSYEIENMNRLGIYSSALYGYDNSLTIAVGGNASYFELGSMDFETSESTWEYGKSMVQTNMNFHNTQSSSSNFYISDVFGIKNASYDGSVMTVTTNTLFSDFDATGYEATIGLTLNSSRKATILGNQNCYVNGIADFGSVQADANGYAMFTVSEVFITGPSQQVLPSNSSYTGKVRVLVNRPTIVSDASSSVSFTNEKAHSGKRSMKLDGSIQFDQPQLKLVDGKKYVVSLWVSKENTKVPTFEPSKYGNGSQELVTLSSTIPGGLSVESTTYSKVVEGWQKVDIEFLITGNNTTLLMNFLPQGGSSIYVDDVRFSPRTGGVTTYVYDADRFWLRASLNVDNYATFFYYDEEGNLTVKKQETEEGIYTITESRGHVSEDN